VAVQVPVDVCMIGGQDSAFLQQVSRSMFLGLLKRPPQMLFRWIAINSDSMSVLTVQSLTVEERKKFHLINRILQMQHSGSATKGPIFLTMIAQISFVRSSALWGSVIFGYVHI
jgi:hypothetical protein